MKVWCYFGADGRICADSSFQDARDALRIMLGWPSFGEVRRALDAGARVEQIEIEMPAVPQSDALDKGSD